MATAAVIVGPILMLIGAAQLCFGTRFGQLFFAGELALHGYAEFSSIPVIASGVTLTLSAFFYASAGLGLGIASAHEQPASASR